MNDMLQRLVKRARNVPEAAILRIEPLLTPRYAPTRASMNTSHPSEIHAETIATTNDATRPEPARIIANTSQEEVHDKETATDSEQSTRRPLRPADATSATSKSRAEPVRATDIGNDPSRVSSDPSGERHAEGVVKPPLQTIVRPSQHPAATRPSAEAPRTTPAAIYDTHVIEENTQNITISIGHVEVRNAPTPAPSAPRRPAFRPAVSLDAFLKRSGGDER
jgi:hypothetical protein